MRAGIAYPSTFAGNEKTLDRMFGAVHESWVEETRRVLAPAMEPDAPKRDRRAVVRYLHERFTWEYRSELALVEELSPLVPAEEMNRLRSGSQELQRICEDLDHVGGSRGAQPVAHLVCELLHRLQLWCAEIELTVGRIARELVADPSS